MARSAIALFADDIRFEQSGKRIIIGLYQDKLLVPEFPASISLTILVIVRISSDDPVKEMKVIIDSPIGKAEFGGPTNPDAFAQTEKPHLATFELQTAMNPLSVDQPSAVVVTVELDGQSIHAGTLIIGKVETGSKEVLTS